MTQSNITLEDLKILVVDDSLDTLNLIMSMLKDLGINQIFTAKDGKEALEFLGADDDGDLVNLILCDWNMPRMTGIELLSQVRTVDPTMPFVMITGSADMQSVREAKSHGVNGYIKKPFSARELQKKLSAMTRIIAHRQSGSENV